MSSPSDAELAGMPARVALLAQRPHSTAPEKMEFRPYSGPLRVPLSVQAGPKIALLVDGEEWIMDLAALEYAVRSLRVHVHTVP